MELSVHHDKIIGVFNRIGAREKERASDAGDPDFEKHLAEVEASD